MIKKYKAIYRDKVVEVQAETTVGAQALGAEMFKAKKGHDVAVVSGKQWKKVEGEVKGWVRGVFRSL
jgi:aspartate/tyrosine/aromatic aminotransferase